MDFVKMHGLGNDFIVVNNMEENLQLQKERMSYLSKELCRRGFGIGADGLVLITSSSLAFLGMRIFNPDGSEAEMCGNAIRCIAKYLWDRGLVGAPNFVIETLAGLKEVEVLLAGTSVRAVRVGMSEPILDSVEIPVKGTARKVLDEEIVVDGEQLSFSAISMGNPHCVIFVSSLEHIPWQKWGAFLESSPTFPARTNVEFVEVLSPREIRVNVWERGAGATLACGTGACAAVVAGILTGRLGSPVEVHLPGGNLKIEWEEGSSVYMEGPAEEVFQGTVNILKGEN